MTRQSAVILLLQLQFPSVYFSKNAVHCHSPASSPLSSRPPMIIRALSNSPRSSSTYISSCVTQGGASALTFWRRALAYWQGQLQVLDTMFGNIDRMGHPGPAPVRGPQESAGGQTQAFVSSCRYPAFPYTRGWRITADIEIGRQG